MKTKLFMLLSFCLTVAFAQSQTQPTKPDYIGELQLVTVTPSLSSKMDQLVSTSNNRRGKRWKVL